MKVPQISTSRILLLASGFVALVVIAACGGGGQGPAPNDARAQAQGLGAGAAISWTPSAVSDTANPGSRQTIAVTFSPSADLKDISVTVVPALRGIVTATPTSFTTLQKGQPVTLTLTVAPSSAQSLGPAEGTIHLLSGNVTIAKPLPVSISLVPPETINGVTVPPAPPADLNNATLAGFDANNNGIRDDVERLLAQFGGNSNFAGLTIFARAEQQALTTGSQSAMAASDQAFLCFKLAASDTDQLTFALLNTANRKFTYKTIMARAPAVDISAIKQGCAP